LGADDWETFGALARTGKRAMVRTQARGASPNHILSRLSRQDVRPLEAHLVDVDLPVKKQLVTRNKRIEDVYFIDAGIASVVADGSGKQIEIGLIGREGMTGLGVVMGNDRSPYDNYMQVAGKGRSISASKLRQADERSTALHRLIMKYTDAFLMQTAQTALANGRSKIEERLARWLLMAQDRLESDEIPLTHEFLAIMLGTQRPGVTVALHALERGGLITTRRSAITILDRKALEESSNGTYLAPAD
jgi:CRP-like cAMP-binding protein